MDRLRSGAARVIGGSAGLLGVVGAALGTQLEGTGNAFEAKREAEREGKRTAEYSDRIHRPDACDGAAIGIDYKWGDIEGEGTQQLSLDVPIDSDISGLHEAPFTGSLGEASSRCSDASPRVSASRGPRRPPAGRGPRASPGPPPPASPCR